MARTGSTEAALNEGTRAARTADDCSLPSSRFPSEKPIATVRRGIRFCLLLEKRAKGG